MSDVFDQEKRSEVMSRIRGFGNLSTEVALASAMRAAKISGWRRHVELRPKFTGKQSNQGRNLRMSIKPDFIFRKIKVAVFVDGCFWHLCPSHAKIPKNNNEFWEKKLNANVDRDTRANEALRNEGWEILRIWEHELADIENVLAKIRNVISMRSLA